MPRKPNTEDGKDPISELMSITSRGQHARIVYRKGGKEGETTRVIEPRKLVEGANGLMIMAVQIEPEQGLRCFAAHKIVHVEEHGRPLDAKQKSGNNFCTGEVVEFTAKFSTTGLASKQEADSTRERPASIWSQPWFSRYVGLVRDVLVDSNVTADEIALVVASQRSWSMTDAQVRAAHAYIFGEELLALSLDGSLDSQEFERVRFLGRSLEKLGWSPVTD
jgi:hypothetical protein